MPQTRFRASFLAMRLAICSSLITLVFSPFSTTLPTIFAQTPLPASPQAPLPSSSPQDRITSPVLKGISANTDTEYLVRLINGDILSGKIIEILSKDLVAKELQTSEKTSDKSSDKAASKADDEAIRLENALGVLTIFASEIVEITPRNGLYRHNHRLYIMPTAEPISGNAFIGIWELLFAYAGVGITDYVSITAGRSLIPGILPNEQATLANLKITPYATPIDGSGTRIFTCVGGNIALLNENNIVGHVFAGATLKGSRTSLTGQVFYKVNAPNFYAIRGGNLFAFNANYAQGTFGLGLGLDSRLSDRHDVHFIGELWNADVLRPSNSALLVGLRLCNTAISMDFGVAVTPQPLAIPFVSFAWTPF
ncbi:MAG: hypothetical protein MUF71_02570 [Candidatus Kapabacteria bacterium]|nr:hypothetical protein [Candidatus Kapabacteria bacterium]